MKNIDLELYKIFYEVGKEKNITKASNALFISQPAITHQIKKLEADLNYTLFYRTKYGVEFTKEGEELFNNIKDSIASLENVPDTLDKYNNKIENLNFASSFGSARTVLATTVPKILKKHPDLNIKLDIMPNDQIIENVLNNSTDIGLINTNKICNENICYYKTIQIDRVFVASKEFIEKYNVTKITKKNLTTLPFIATGKRSATRILLEEYLAENCINLVPKLDVDSFEMVLDYLTAGCGFALFNKQYANQLLKSGKLIELKSDIKFPSKTIYLAINKNRQNNKFLHEIIEFIQKDI